MQGYLANSVAGVVSDMGGSYDSDLGSLTKIRNSNGIAYKVSILEKASPQTIAVATGPQISDLPPSPSASEDSPAIVVSVVIRIGMMRLRAA